MKKKDVSSKKTAKKIELDLDAALEEVAKKLRPSANAPGCGSTNSFGSHEWTGPNQNCFCYCCSNN